MGKVIMVVAVALTGIVLFSRVSRRTKPTPLATRVSDAVAVAKLEDEGAPLPIATT